MATGHHVRSDRTRTPRGGAVGNGADPRVAKARESLAAGRSENQVAASLQLSRMGLRALLARDDERRAELARRAAVLDPDYAHLVCFDVPTEPLPPVQRSEAEAAAWTPRLIFVGRLHDMADAFAGPVAAGLRHLADLHEHHPTFYPELDIREGDGLPWRGYAEPQVSLFGSASQQCAEG